MRALVTPVALVKSGNLPSEYDDAHYPRSRCRIEGEEARVCVADGASRAWGGGQWATMLAAAYCRSASDDAMAVIARAAKAWKRWLPAYLCARARRGRAIQFYEEPGLARGPAATILGLTLRDARRYERSWHAWAVGDCNLFQVRGEQVITAFPFTTSADMPYAPDLVWTDGTEQTASTPQYLVAEGAWYDSDVFYVMTDALALWFLRNYEAGGTPWTDLAQVCQSDAEFQQWAEERRTVGELDNDDLALVCVRVLGEVNDDEILA